MAADGKGYPHTAGVGTLDGKQVAFCAECKMLPILGNELFVWLSRPLRIVQGLTYYVECMGTGPVGRGSPKELGPHALHIRAVGCLLVLLLNVQPRYSSGSREALAISLVPVNHPLS